MMINKRAGFSLLELILVLAIIAAIIIRATMFYSSSSSSAKANDALDRIMALNSAASRWILAGNADLSAVSIPEFKTEGFLPADFPEINPWGGGIIVSGAVGDQILHINIQSVPDKDASNLITKASQIACASVQNVIPSPTPGPVNSGIHICIDEGPNCSPPPSCS
jgi:prepilin-type N-terminal cleavage/methylation domain-containing protein